MAEVSEAVRAETWAPARAGRSLMSGAAGSDRTAVAAAAVTGTGTVRTLPGAARTARRPRARAGRTAGRWAAPGARGRGAGAADSGRRGAAGAPGTRAPCRGEAPLAGTGAPVGPTGRAAPEPRWAGWPRSSLAL